MLKLTIAGIHKSTDLSMVASCMETVSSQLKGTKCFCCYDFVKMTSFLFQNEFQEIQNFASSLGSCITICTATFKI